MKLKEAEKIFKELTNIKQKEGFLIVDTHVHPDDVMGVDIMEGERVRREPRKAGLMEKMDYGALAKIGSRIFFKFFPTYIHESIRKMYQKENLGLLLEEMQCALIDKAVILPVDPWSNTEKIGREYTKNDRFIILASLDIHKIRISEIEEKIEEYIKNFNIVGLKLHPNLQGFKPQPTHNKPEITEKLRKIYSVAAQKKLYLLFHGGTSFYTKQVESKYNYIKRSAKNALLTNFCDEEGRSELFENYGMPIVIAHLGNYGLLNPDYKLVEIVSKKYSHVFFDTAGASFNLIKKSIEKISSKKILFGSDALYNKTFYNLAITLKAIKEAKNEEKEGEKIKNILCNNYLNKILKI